MFHCFELQTIKCPKRQAGKIIALVPLDSNKIISLDENGVISLYKVPSGTIQGQMILSFKARRLVALGNGSVAVLAAEDRSVYEVQVERGRANLIVHFQASHHYNTQQVKMRERECFSTMTLGSFNAVQACYLRQERTEERRMKLHFLNKPQGKWITTSHEYPLNGSMADKLDQYSKMAIWKQQIATGGEFDFTSINLQTKVQEEIHLASGSFTLFTVVRAVKTVHDGLMVCLNHKNPQILFFKVDQLQRSQNIPTNLLWVVPTQQYFLTMCISQQEKFNVRVDLRQNDGQLMDKFDSICSELVVSRQGDFIIEYDREKKDSGQISFRAIRVLRKQKLYLHLMEQNSQLAKNSLSNSFMREVLSLLQ